jgi:predicted PurR-regulated permease PerM
MVSEPRRHTLSAKLRRLPVDLLIALTNATAVLVIVAAVLTLVTIAQINNFAGNVVSAMTDAALSKIDLPSRGVLTDIRKMTEEISAFGNTLQNIREGENPALQSEIARLKERMGNLRTSIDRLTNTRTILTDEAIGQLGRSVSDTLTKMRACSSDEGRQAHFSLPSDVGMQDRVQKNSAPAPRHRDLRN